MTARLNSVECGLFFSPPDGQVRNLRDEKPASSQRPIVSGVQDRFGKIGEAGGVRIPGVLFRTYTR